MVYVINTKGQPLMPTKRHGHVRRLLRDKKAKVVKRCPFTIQLLYETPNITQPITLGVDAGSKTVGLSATTKKEVLFEAELTLRNDIVKLLSTRRELRRTRRNRKTRYRKPRFNNRTKPKGWLPPSIQHKINTHINAINNTHKILPITNITIKIASFDTQKLKAQEQNKPLPQGKDYQQGEQLGFWNVHEYVLFRDNHTCQCCKGKSKDSVLNVHHIESRQTGGNAPNNLVTLCRTCHQAYHAGKINLPDNIKRGKSYRDPTFMGIMRKNLVTQLKEKYDNIEITYGYITKNTRITHGLTKTHAIDARCISGNPDAIPPSETFIMRKVRRHNRQLHRMTIGKGGYRKANQAPKYVHDFQLFDKVKYNNTECFIFGRRRTGYFSLRLLDGTTISNSAFYKKLKLLEKQSPVLTERRNTIPPHN